METEDALESASLAERLVLLSLLEVESEPAQTHDLRRTCLSLVERADDPVVGRVSEAEIIRSLYRLEAAGAVAEHEPPERSPIGKGRPKYELAIEEEAVLEAARERSTLEGVVEDVVRE